jgi:hypothetical protein
VVNLKKEGDFNYDRFLLNIPTTVVNLKKEGEKQNISIRYIISYVYEKY